MSLYCHLRFVSVIGRTFCAFRFRRMSTVLVPNHKFKVFVTHSGVPEIGIEALKEMCDVSVNDEKTVTRETILAKVKGADAIFWAGPDNFNEEILDAAGPQLKVAAVISAGLDHVDVEAFKKRGIKLGHAPGIISDAVGDVAIMLALAASRRMHEARLAIEQNKWKFDIQFMLGRDIYDSVVGVVGLGNIGQNIVKKLKPFSVCQFLYSDVAEVPAAKDLNCQYCTFDQLIANSDFVFLACPLTDQTRNIINETSLSRMRDNAVLVNVARGACVDHDALVKALQEQKIFAAGLDVMTPEPLPADHPLLKLPNCIITPHFGSSTVQTRGAMALLTAHNILMGLTDQPMLAPAY